MSSEMTVCGLLTYPKPGILSGRTVIVTSTRVHVCALTCPGAVSGTCQKCAFEHVILLAPLMHETAAPIILDSKQEVKAEEAQVEPSPKHSSKV